MALVIHFAKGSIFNGEVVEEPMTMEHISAEEMGWTNEMPEVGHHHEHSHHTARHMVADKAVDEYGKHDHPHTHIRTSHSTKEHDHDEVHNG